MYYDFVAFQRIIFLFSIILRLLFAPLTRTHTHSVSIQLQPFHFYGISVILSLKFKTNRIPTLHLKSHWIQYGLWSLMKTAWITHWIFIRFEHMCYFLYTEHCPLIMLSVPSSSLPPLQNNIILFWTINYNSVMIKSIACEFSSNIHMNWSN